MITITLTENCGIKAGGLDIYAAGVRKISCPGNIGTGRETVQNFNIPFNWAYGESTEWKAENTVQLTIEKEDGLFDNSIMGKDFEMKNEDGSDKYTYYDGGKNGLEALHYTMSNYGKEIIEDFFPNIGTVEVTYLT